MIKNCLWCEKTLINIGKSFARKKFCNSYCQGKWHYHKKSKKELEKTRVCRWCDKSILHRYGFVRYCNKQCARRYLVNKNREKSMLYQRKRNLSQRPIQINELEKDGYVKCLICLRYYRQITQGHLKWHHNINSTKEYIQKFPKAKLMSENAHKERSKIMNKINPTKGTKRPQHVKDAVSKAHIGVVTAGAWKVGDTAGEKNIRWIDGRSFEPYGKEFNNKLKEQIRTRDNYRCQQCNKLQKELYHSNGKKYSLIVHHIDRNKKNNNPDNLVSVCLSCHVKIHNQDYVIK